MIFRESKLRGVFEIEIERHVDERGFFARTWCKKEFEEHALDSRVAQSSISFNARRGTLRGVHYQAAPCAETKIVRCTQGSVYDVVLDLRGDSPTFKKWISVILSAEQRNMIYIPEGCAHGFLTLADNTEVQYQMTEFFAPESARGVRWDDPAFGITWPEKVEVISERDRTYPDFK